MIVTNFVKSLRVRVRIYTSPRAPNYKPSIGSSTQIKLPSANTRPDSASHEIWWKTSNMIEEKPLEISMTTEPSSVFAAFDKDGDGKVSASELRCAMSATLDEDVSEEEVTAILAAADANGDGLLNQEEFSRLAAGAHGEDDVVVKRRCLMEAFGMYASSSTDDTTTTMITPASLRRTLSRLGSHQLGVEECRAMICRFDLDGDGALSFDEFRVMMMA
uniref:Uncharacterized protein n=1 Tax=Avena sativa TaxID=4498 RepID=A0ACD6A4V0_AVESA